MRRPRTKWWDWLCDERYRHVAAYGWADGAQCWVVVDPGENVCWVSAVTQWGLETWLIANAPDITSIVRIRAPRRFAGWRHPFPWCTGVVASLLGWPRGALRPQTLRDDLLANGGEEIGASDEDEG